jgi:hypothetical protein
MSQGSPSRESFFVRECIHKKPRLFSQTGLIQHMLFLLSDSAVLSSGRAERRSNRGSRRDGHHGA